MQFALQSCTRIYRNIFRCWYDEQPTTTHIALPAHTCIHMFSAELILATLSNWSQTRTASNSAHEGASVSRLFFDGVGTALGILLNIKKLKKMFIPNYQKNNDLTIHTALFWKKNCIIILYESIVVLSMVFCYRLWNNRCKSNRPILIKSCWISNPSQWFDDQWKRDALYLNIEKDITVWRSN